MRIYIFKSQEQRTLRAFAADPAGEKLPSQFRPWQAIGVVAPNRAPPHGLSRTSIEKAIADHGYQLWRMRAEPKPS
ncbi:MAG: hypothetical protein HY056_01835 [Proteobacteria bacterium]|nr:hypothetical protein [Pseudomonadota bacterium]